MSVVSITIKCKKLISLQHRVRAMKSHISKTAQIIFMGQCDSTISYSTYNPLDVTPFNFCTAVF